MKKGKIVRAWEKKSRRSKKKWNWKDNPVEVLQRFGYAIKPLSWSETKFIVCSKYCKSPMIWDRQTVQNKSIELLNAEPKTVGKKK